MVLYECPRCHYETTKKSHMRNHYSRKRVCKTVHTRKSIKDCLFELETMERMKTSELLEKVRKENEYNLKRVKEEYNNRLKIVMNKKNSIKEENKRSYVYMLQEREFINLNEPVYKIGKTINPKSRFCSYPKGSEILFISLVSDCHQIEKDIIETFNDKFVHRNDIGKEYFQGDDMEMIQEIMEIIKNSRAAKMILP